MTELTEDSLELLYGYEEYVFEIELGKTRSRFFQVTMFTVTMLAIRTFQATCS